MMKPAITAFAKKTKSAYLEYLTNQNASLKKPKLFKT